MRTHPNPTITPTSAFPNGDIHSAQVTVDNTPVGRVYLYDTAYYAAVMPNGTKPVAWGFDTPQAAAKYLAAAVMLLKSVTR